MLEFLQFYTTNKSKLLNILLEILYAFSILIFANELYGKEITITSLINGAQSVSKDFFVDVVGIGLTYVFVAIVAHVFTILILTIFERLISRVRYREAWRKLKLKNGEAYTFDNFMENRENMSDFNTLASGMFIYTKKEKLSELRLYFTGMKFSTLAVRFFIMLSSFLMVSLSYLKSSFGVIESFVLIGLLASVVLYYFAINLERIVNSPDFMRKINDERKVLAHRKILTNNPSCYQKDSKRTKGTIQENIFFVRDITQSTEIIAWIILVDRSILEGEIIRKILENSKTDNGVFKVLVDVFDLIPDKYSLLPNVKIIKPDDQINLDKEVNALVLTKEGN